MVREGGIEFGRTGEKVRRPRPLVGVVLRIG
jgi:hypothetical protein